MRCAYRLQKMYVRNVLTKRITGSINDQSFILSVQLVRINELAMVTVMVSTNGCWSVNCPTSPVSFTDSAKRSRNATISFLKECVINWENYFMRTTSSKKLYRRSINGYFVENMFLVSNDSDSWTRLSLWWRRNIKQKNCSFNVNRMRAAYSKQCKIDIVKFIQPVLPMKAQ